MPAAATFSPGMWRAEELRRIKHVRERVSERRQNRRSGGGKQLGRQLFIPHGAATLSCSSPSVVITDSLRYCLPQDERQVTLTSA